MDKIDKDYSLCVLLYMLAKDKIDKAQLIRTIASYVSQMNQPCEGTYEYSPYKLHALVDFLGDLNFREDPPAMIAYSQTIFINARGNLYGLSFWYGWLDIYPNSALINFSPVIDKYYNDKFYYTISSTKANARKLAWDCFEYVIGHLVIHLAVELEKILELENYEIPEIEPSFEPKSIHASKTKRLLSIIKFMDDNAVKYVNLKGKGESFIELSPGCEINRRSNITHVKFKDIKSVIEGYKTMKEVLG